MDTVVKKLQETTVAESKKFRDSANLKKFENASEYFKKLVKQGIAKERGYNLQSIEESHIKTINFNTSK